MSGAETGTRSHSRVLYGIALIVAAALVSPAADAIAKHLASTYPPVQILWMRYVVQLAMILPLFGLRLGWSSLRSRRPALQLGRCLLFVLGTLAFITAIKFVPLADAIAVLFSSALLMVALSAPLLGERVEWQRWAAVVFGFMGTLIIMRPGLGLVHWAATLAFVFALSNALFQISSRALASSDSPATSLFYLTVVGIVTTGPLMPFVWTGMSLEAWLWTIGSAACALLGQYLLIKAFQYASASVLAPFNYAEIASATALGYFWFGDLPDRWTTLGLAVVIASGLYVIKREGSRQTAARGR